MRHQNVNETMSRWLIHKAASSAPADLAGRLAEEWQADCGARESALSQLRFALGCCWAARVIVQEHGPTSIAVAATVGRATALLHPLGDESASSARRSGLLFLAAGLHIALFVALMTGLAFRIAAVMPVAFHHQVSLAPPDHALPRQVMTARIEFPLSR